MTNHKPAVVHDSEETLELAELNRKRMYEKMKSPQCIQNKVKFVPPDYSKENYLAIFAPQRDLTPEQIFWAKDEKERKKVEASVLKTLSTPTVYPPNTPVKLVPRGSSLVTLENEEHHKVQHSNIHVIPSTRVKSSTKDSGSKPRSNTKNNRSNRSFLGLDQGVQTYVGETFKLKKLHRKFIGTVKFGNDHFGAIMGYGDYVYGDSVISKVYYVEGLGAQSVLCRKFCDSDLEIAFRLHSCFVRDMNGVDLLKGSHSTNLYTIAIGMICESPSSMLDVKRSKIKYGCGIRRLKPSLNFGSSMILLEKIWVHATNYVLSTDKDLELLFQPMFDEYFEVTRVDEPIPSTTVVNAQVVPPGTSVSTTFAQDAPSTIGPTIEDTPITQATLHPLVNPVTGEPSSAQSSSGDDVKWIPVDHDSIQRNGWLLLMYLTASRPDLVFVVCMCARYQAKPTKKHLEAIKWVFRYLRGTIHMGLWYPKDNAMALTAYADADHAGCQDTRRR
ncbi:hypothetical protein Tco_0092382 [Tanacetum coccineum]